MKPEIRKAILKDVEAVMAGTKTHFEGHPRSQVAWFFSWVCDLDEARGSLEQMRYYLLNEDRPAQRVEKMAEIESLERRISYLRNRLGLKGPEPTRRNNKGNIYTEEWEAERDMKILKMLDEEEEANG